MAVHIELEDRVLTATLQRPDAGNAIDEAVLVGLHTTVAAAQSDPSVRALVIRSEGKHFCIGLDRDLLVRAFDDLDYFSDVLRRYGAILSSLESLDVPVVAAVQGTTRAGGFELILACDFVLCSSEARIGDVHTKFGVIPGGGSTQRALRKIGDQRARELIYTSRWLTGADAAEYGIALRAVQPHELDAAVVELVTSLTDKSRACLGTTKRVMTTGADLPLRDGLQLEIDALVDYLRTSPDGREGFRAYIEGRAPAWA